MLLKLDPLKQDFFSGVLFLLKPQINTILDPLRLSLRLSAVPGPSRRRYPVAAGAVGALRPCQAARRVGPTRHGTRT